MKSFGRLLMAAALIVPAGVATAQQRGGRYRSRTTSRAPRTPATLKFNPGVSLTTGTDSRDEPRSQPSPVPRQKRALAGLLGECTGIGITGTTGGSLSFTVQRAGR